MPCDPNYDYGYIWKMEGWIDGWETLHLVSLLHKRLAILAQILHLFYVL